MASATRGERRAGKVDCRDKGARSRDSGIGRSELDGVQLASPPIEGAHHKPRHRQHVVRTAAWAT
eukprot:622505-Pyramimonas_sp.AAC.1